MNWNDIASWWDMRMGENGDWFNNALIKPYITDIIANNSNKRKIKVLDVGCGNGFFCRECAKLNAKVTGIDASAEMISKAQQYESKNIKYYVCDVSKEIPLSDTFDFIIINNVLQDVENISGFLSNIRMLCNRKTNVLITIRHPCFHPKKVDLGWKLKTENGKEIFSGQGLTAILDSKEAVEGVFFANDEYFGEIENERKWENGTTQSYNRTITTYVREFLTNGFKITDMFEPYPSELDNSVAKLAKRIPVFIIFRLGI